MKELTYADIRKVALEHGINDTRLHIDFGLLTDTSKSANGSRQDLQSTYRIIK